MTAPKFANTDKKLSPDRRGLRNNKEVSNSEEKVETNMIDRKHINGAEFDRKVSSSVSLKQYMEEKITQKKSEPTKPITLRFEESLWERVEYLRGGLNKNDFFKELVRFYDKHAQ